MIIFTSRGDWGAFLIYPYLFNTSGEWIGWVTPHKEIFNLDGSYIGMISPDQRILRKKSLETMRPRRVVSGASCTPGNRFRAARICSRIDSVVSR